MLESADADPDDHRIPQAEAAALLGLVGGAGDDIHLDALDHLVEIAGGVGEADEGKQA
jgi:hypothetical protein